MDPWSKIDSEKRTFVLCVVLAPHGRWGEKLEIGKIERGVD
jgi:hypothetical protein